MKNQTNKQELASIYCVYDSKTKGVKKRVDIDGYSFLVEKEYRTPHGTLYLWGLGDGLRDGLVDKEPNK